MNFKKIKSKNIVLTILFCLVMLIISFLCLNQLFLNKDKVDEIEIDNFKLIKEYSEEKFSKTYKFLNNDTDILKLKVIANIDSDNAKKIIKSNLNIIRFQFSDSISHYPDVISREIKCDEKYIPNELLDNNISYFFSYVNHRLNYGICVEDLIKYRSIYAWKYCYELKELRNMEIFWNNTEHLKYNFNFIENNICK